MTTVQSADRDKPVIKVAAPGFMPLVIEAVGRGPRGLPLVSVAHSYVENGDLMRDPELTCEVGAGGEFYPVSFTQDNVGAYHEAVFVDEAGRVRLRHRVLKDLRSLAKELAATDPGVAEALVARLHALHGRLGLPALDLKPPAPPKRPKRKVS